jgi:hypothetical protein
MPYKLVTQDWLTLTGQRNETDWSTLEWREATGTGDRPCTDAFIHYYHHPLIAVYSNPIHVAIPDPRLIEIEIDREHGNDGLKGWCKRARMVREIGVPQMTTAQRVRAAIYIAQTVCDDSAWHRWADDWLSGRDRSLEAAELAEWAAGREAAETAAWAAQAAKAAARAAVWVATARAAAEAARSAAAEAVRATEILAEARAEPEAHVTARIATRIAAHVAVRIAAAEAAAWTGKAVSRRASPRFDLLHILQRAVADER